MGLDPGKYRGFCPQSTRALLVSRKAENDLAVNDEHVVVLACARERCLFDREVGVDFSNTVYIKL